MIDSQWAAQLLFNHRLATQEQILACWPHITSEKDVGMLLVERGILPRQTYDQLAAYMETQSATAGRSPPESARTAQVAAGESSQSGIEPRTVPPARREDPEISVSDPAGSVNEPGGSVNEPGGESLLPSDGGEAFIDLNDENWSPIPQDAGETGPRKTSRAEHALRKAETSATAHAVAAPDAVAAPATVGPQSGWEELLAFARRNDAADLHLSAGNPILLRRFGSLQAATADAMEQDSLRRWVERALTLEQLRTFEEKGDLELIYTLPGWGRYRVTVLKQRRGWDVTARVIPATIRGFEDSGLPEACRELTQWAQGLVLVTGPVGCGKTSTLSTLVEMVNQERHDHIITIEEPIEILYEPAHCRITQRQIGPHTLTRDAALRAALREDPDIIVISELRDLDTIRLAVSAAETGHLVFGTMNTTNAARTLYRLIDSFPPEEQGIIRNMISESLRGVISQQLVPRKDGTGMEPAFEVLLINTAVANMIRKDEAHQLHTAMLTGKSSGMVLLDDSLRGLVEKGLVDPADAMARATVPKDFEKYAGRK